MARLLGGGASSAPATLLLVLLCVLASFGMLVAALFTGGIGWAWGSVTASAVGGALLVYDWVGRRRAARQSPGEHDAAAEPPPPVD